jgi:sulfotransferase
MPTFHFISGLPRSGSTLLSALLRQNPRFASGVTSPVAPLINSLLPRMSGPGEFAVFFDDVRRRRILRGVFEAYYDGPSADRVVFDTNRSWTAKLALLLELYPRARVICLVREVGWIVDSIERALRRHPLQVSRIFNFQADSSIYSRTEALMNSETGLIGNAWSSLREAWFSENARSIIVIKYDELARNPAGVLNGLYKELGEPAFSHDFENIAFDATDYDTTLGIPGFHSVRPRVDYREREPVIPPDIFAKYAETAFWLRPESRGAVVLP